ncbi:enoyl-CoA hydratase [Gordonia jinghuaiqii]|uniref:Enoyl-CoA hydratase/isomerase family protein n=1 Tax=Gordonia jinghuaiqii TaxID=2758710 RepID=A0A7D7R454_9ACTN|nr:enoyl-CoA hydratase-related protein [Gordonia jinghuaiqii]MCR5978406.1 enoyl-CoA hydratase [Gordonia jinghuaiqii]QMT02747.1 enoyl-CoA hydratase/isomerase family protein [Gordonia jinghuaiqii]
MTIDVRSGASRVEVTVDNGLARVTLNRPEKKNAIGTEMWSALEEALAEIRNCSEVRVLILAGAGDTFCAGADLSSDQAQGKASTHRSQHERMQWFNTVVAELASLTVPTIAAVDGAAVGIGMNLALSCDFVIASERARFCEIFIRRALSVDGGGSWTLPRLVGMRKAKELCMLGESITASEALELGLVYRVVGVDALEASVDDLANRLRGFSPSALASTKALLNDSFSSSYSQALEAEARLQALNIAGPDFQAAVRAFAAKSRVG